MATRRQLGGLDDGGLAGRPPGMAPSVRSDRAAQSSLRWSAARRDRFCVRNQMRVASCRLVQGRRSNYAVGQMAFALRTRLGRKLLSAALLKRQGCGSVRLEQRGAVAFTLMSVAIVDPCDHPMGIFVLEDDAARVHDGGRRLSPRAREGFPVAAPVTWAQVECGIRPDAFTIARAPPAARGAREVREAEHWPAKWLSEGGPVSAGLASWSRHVAMRDPLRPDREHLAPVRPDVSA